MSYDLRRIGEDRDGDEVQYEYCSSSSFSDAESCSSEDEGTPDQNEFSGCRNSDASVYDFSSLMAQLPNSNRRRGLSQYYEGKSQSFTSLSDVQCLEDLPKRENPCNIKRKMMIIKPCKSYADGLCDNPQSRQPSSRGSCGNLMARNSNNGRDLLCSRPPAIPLNKNSRRLS